LFAFPLTKREFFADSKDDSGKEYARLFRTQLAGFSDEEVWARYENVVLEPATSVMEFAAAHGVLTRSRATAEVWRDTVREKQVVSLVAHWHAAGFSSEMIKNLPGVMSDIKAAQGPAGRAMNQALAVKRINVADAEDLAIILNEFLCSTLIIPDRPQPGLEWVTNDPEQILVRNFDVVRMEFTHWQLRPAGMELADGIYSVAEMVSTFSSEYNGTLDLRMCHSVILGEAIKRAAPRCRIVMNQYPIRPLVQLPLYKLVLGMLEKGNYDFAGAVMALHKAIMERLQ